MLELGQLDLQFALGARGTLGEDVENQAGAVDHATFEFAFEIAFLHRRNLVVEDDQIGFAGEGRRLAKDLGVKQVGPLDGMRASELGRAQVVFILGA